MSRRLAKALTRWLAQAGDPSLPRVLITKVKATSLQFRFEGYPSALVGHLSSSNLSIGVLENGEIWDLLLDLDCVPLVTSEGVVCTLCPENQRRPFASIADLHVDHLFKPFGAWLTTRLLPATHIALHALSKRERYHATWASLIREADETGSETLVRRIALPKLPNPFGKARSQCDPDDEGSNEPPEMTGPI